MCGNCDGTLDEAGGNLCGSVDGWGCRSVVGGAALSVARPRSKTACRSTRCVHDVAVYVEQRDVGRVSRSCSEYLGPIDWNRRYLWGDGDGNVLVAVTSTAACERKGGGSDKNDAGRAKVRLETPRTSDFNDLHRITRFVTLATKISSFVCVGHSLAPQQAKIHAASEFQGEQVSVCRNGDGVGCSVAVDAARGGDFRIHDCQKLR